LDKRKFSELSLRKDILNWEDILRYFADIIIDTSTTISSCRFPHQEDEWKKFARMTFSVQESDKLLYNVIVAVKKRYSANALTSNSCINAKLAIQKVDHWTAQGQPRVHKTSFYIDVHIITTFFFDK
jgi:hypothetical protein